MLGNRNSQYSFAKTPDVKMARSTFDRSFARKCHLNFDFLLPIYVDEILPGDTCNLSVNAFARLQTQIVPTMDNMYLDFFFFFVPNRLVWTNWEKFCGAQTNPGDSISYTIPVVPTGVRTANSVGDTLDYWGIPLIIGTSININSLPLRGYNLIYNAWFRDENLIDSAVVDVDDGPDTLSDYAAKKRAKKHDYFTSCLPWPQKGTALTLPLTATAPIYRTDSAANGWKAYVPGTNTLDAGAILSTNASGVVINTTSTGARNFSPEGGLYTDLSAAGGTIAELRTAFQLQSLLELDARSGTRYVEILESHFNVVSPDFRLQRPEYLGGGEMVINSHVVPQTSPTSGTDAKASLGSFATGTSSGRIGFTKSFVEHGYVIGICCPRGEITYQQGIERMWYRSTRYDFFWPKLQEIGEQAVYTREIYATGNTAIDNDVFGYQERYAEYKYKPSQIMGLFRSYATGTLDVWHLAEKFTSQPLLNDVFIEQATPYQRNQAVSTNAALIADFFFSLKHTRPMATYSIPASLGRF